MTDYIKREDAKRAVWGCSRDTGIDEAPFEYAEGLLEDVPAEDVAPVRHAKWEGCKGDITCSACGEYALYDSEDIEMQYRTLYCPFCGAKMDEGGSNGTDD